jgi:hypothetical protein
MDKTKVNLIIILFLMIITGFVIYYMYLKPEKFTNIQENFETTTTPAITTTSANTTTPAITTTIPNTTIPTPTFTCPDLNPKIPVAIVSRYFGVGFNIYPVKSTSSNILQNQTYLIEHIPITTTGTSGGMYSISSDGSFTIKLKNNEDSTQWWSMIELTDPIDKSVYQVMIPNNSPTVALQYANGNLSIRPYTAPGFEGQKWLKSDNIVTRGIPVLNYSPSSMFTTEFDPYSTTSSVNMNSLSDSNNKQVSDVITAVKSGIQQYLSQTSNSQNNGQISSSSLGNKNMPLSVNLNLGGGGGGGGGGGRGSSGGSGGSGSGGSTSSSTSGISFFDNVTGSASDSEILSILDKYEAKSANGIGSQTIYSQNDLQNSLNTSSTGCKLVNINDYTPNRVSTCNCKI